MRALVSSARGWWTPGAARPRGLTRSSRLERQWKALKSHRVPIINPPFCDR